VATVSPAADKPRLFAWNLIAILATGVLLSFWMLYYTDYFPVFGGLLGLTGVFAWVAFIAGVLRDERKDALQDWLDRSILQSHATWLVCIAGIVLFAVFVAGRTGTLIVDTNGDEVAREVLVAPVDGTDSDEVTFRLSPQSEQQQLLTTAWLQPRRYRVRASGLPDVFIDVHPLRRSEISFPDAAITAPVLLVRPDERLSISTLNGGYKLVVKRNDQDFGEIADFRGTTAWIGARSDVAIPQWLIDKWRREMPGANDAALARWRWPAEFKDAPALRPGDRVRVVIVESADETNTHEACASVVGAQRRMEFPQEVVVHADHKC
jgi:hypothetical protein